MAVGNLHHSNPPFRSNSEPHSTSTEPCEQESNQTPGFGHLIIGNPSENCGRESVSFTKTTLDSQSAVSAESSSIREFNKCIGRFFYEAGIDFDAIKSPSFQRMINASLDYEDTPYTIPNCEDLRGWILLEALKESQQNVSEIRCSWASTHCTILLDGWEDSVGRNLLNVLAYCPKGTVYIQSADIFGFEQNSDSLLVLLDEVVKEVGIENVVQIITFSISASIEKVGQQLMDKNWWLEFGNAQPELQQLATRIVFQMFNNASGIQFKNNLAGKLLTKGRNPIEQHRLADLVFVHYNLHLQNFNLHVASAR
ncbi:hypothetical protein ACH5RR_036677 [Cinchona calisaya]|uniref:DUF659 domain-containing protein n=1 Tax=Cinchona calisaya TaxID=153742 RepID=A0ABD2Y3Z4_9GENT